MLAPYGQSLALLTDLYQLTMACGYWREGIADREAVFHHYFRRAPFDGAFAVAAGLRTALQWLDGLRFESDDLEYLAGLGGAGGRPLFESGFLDYLADFTFRCDMDAVPEGTVVFAQEPLARVHGPLLHCQLAETALLNIVNFQTLVATKAARVAGSRIASSRPATSRLRSDRHVSPARSHGVRCWMPSTTPMARQVVCGRSFAPAAFCSAT